MSKILNALLKRWGPPAVKKRIWDKEYSSGKWDHRDPRSERTTERDIVLDVIEKYSEGLDILDLGCGTGATGLEIADRYRKYVGVDVSEVAVTKATSVVQEQAKQSKMKYMVGDVLSFVPNAMFSIILFRESLYYCPDRNVEALLRRYSGYLSPGGVFIVRLHDRVRYDGLVQTIESSFSIQERIAPTGGKAIVLVFSPAQKL